jgi:hypothetical protein
MVGDRGAQPSGRSWEWSTRRCAVTLTFLLLVLFLALLTVADLLPVVAEPHEPRRARRGR